MIVLPQRRSNLDGKYVWSLGGGPVRLKRVCCVQWRSSDVLESPDLCGSLAAKRKKNHKALAFGHAAYKDWKVLCTTESVEGAKLVVAIATAGGIAIVGCKTRHDAAVLF